MATTDRGKWFAMGLMAGVLASVFGCQAAARLCGGPRDITSAWPAELRASVKEWCPWALQARGYRAGPFVIWTPSASSASSCFFFPERDKLPAVFVRDVDEDGDVDEITVVDKKGRGVLLTDKDNDFAFDSLHLVLGMGTDGLSFSDENLDGTYDTRLTVDPLQLEVNIEGAWYKLIHREGKRYVEVKNKLRSVEPVAGAWRFADAEADTDHSKPETGPTPR